MPSVVYPYHVTVTRREDEGFGFVIISSLNRSGSTIGKYLKYIYCVCLLVPAYCLSLLIDLLFQGESSRVALPKGVVSYMLEIIF